MESFVQLKEKVGEIEAKLRITFHKKEFILAALTHRSYVNEHRKEGCTHNERLEFLGDSVLNLVVADFLYHQLPTEAEGMLSQLRSRLVEATSCARYMTQLEIAEYLLLGRGELIHAGKVRPSILADAFEAVVGAIYLDAGYEHARAFLLFHFEEEANRMMGAPVENYKADLQDYSQKQFQQVPIYKVVEEMGPEHAKRFKVAVWVQDEEMGIGEGSSKKEAEQMAAKKALEKVNHE